MEDLDSLLEDLGRGKSNTVSKKSRPPSSRVDLNELEDLMEDLAAPTARQTPTPAPVIIPAAQPAAQQPNKTSEPARTGREPSTSMDDLDALMESLNTSSRSSRRVSTKPNIIVPEPEPEPVHVPPPKISPVVQPKQDNWAPKPAAKQPEPVRENSSSFYNNSDPLPVRNSTGPAKGDELDNLLKNLSSQMNTIDSENPYSKGTCHTCRNSILGEVIQALGRTYHPEHFVCGNCKEPLGTRNFFESNGAPHCERCFQELYCPKCAHCDKPVLDRCITALGKKWHMDHFICTQCLKPFAGGNFFERDGRPYCEADFYALFAPKCAGCHDPIRGDCINALGQQWHPEHFACAYCQKSFSGGSFFEFQNKPYCETHYHQQTGSLCSGCGKPITGKCVNALSKKWHPEHFVCAFCMNSLAGGSFTEHNSKAYCKECHGKLFGQS